MSIQNENPDIYADQASDNPPNLVRDHLEKSRLDVLDISLRNPLLNFSPSKRNGLKIIDEISHQIYRILVAEEKTMTFLASDVEEEELIDGIDGVVDSEEEDEEEEVLVRVLEAEPDSAPGGVAERHTDTKLQTAYTKPNLALRLRETSRVSRLSIEEQGVNTLYLAIGFLKWFESESSEREMSAPLILIPVQLLRSDVRESFQLKWSKDEIEPNLTIESKLKSDFGVSLPDIETEDAIDVDGYLTRIEERIGQYTRWRVEHNEMQLGFFSFSKLLIYKDLDGEGWPEDKQPADHPLIQKLFGPNGFASEAMPSGGSGSSDTRKVEEVELHPVVDADSSQSMAVIDTMEGKNLVIQGPPGTGKSQTITYVICEALAQDKTVLFVAEKMAALEVVKRRLESVHLGDACLELHSDKTNKRAVLDELRNTVNLGRPEISIDASDRSRLVASRERLNEYCRDVNKPIENSELKPQQLIGHLTQLSLDGLVVEGRGLQMDEPVTWNRSEFIRRQDLVNEIQQLLKRIGSPKRHFWWVSGRRQFLPADQHTIRETLSALSSAVSQLEDGSALVLSVVGGETTFDEMNASTFESTVRQIEMVRDAPDLLGANCGHDAWIGQANVIESLAESVREYADTRNKHAEVLIPEAWDQDVLQIRTAFRSYGEKWWRFISPAFRNAKNQLAGMCRGAVPESVSDQIELLDAIMDAGRLKRNVDDSSNLLNGLFPSLALGGNVDAYARLAVALSWILKLRQDEQSGTLPAGTHLVLDKSTDPDTLHKSISEGNRLLSGFTDALTRLTEEIQPAEGRFDGSNGFGDWSFDKLKSWLNAASQHVGELHDIVRFNELEVRCDSEGIASVSEFAATHENASEEVGDQFLYAYYSALLNHAFKERPTLAQFERSSHEYFIEEFRKLDMESFNHNRALIAEKHWQGMPQHEAGGGQIAVLRREFEKKSRHMPVRKLISEAGRAIQNIKPVFMMSPLSIAKYISPGSIEFDLVVFDEASQVRPVDAMGAILRGKQCIVVGDSKQLPPTSFFDRMTEDSDDASQTADLESILGMFVSQSAKQRLLEWHYRSRHESLIAVSNHEFYDDRLVVFPSPDAGKESTGLIFHHNPDAHYKRKGINNDEAKTVAEAVIAHARESHELTLGVVAFNSAQARLVEAEVDILRRQNPDCEQFFHEHPNEPFFVKNLENVQGDERDIILISIGYGKIESSYLPMNFGPLNREGGERRLNVLITRARRRCEVFSNFVGADLDLSRSNAQGIKALKTFLEYAETGNIEVPHASGRDADSPFEEAVAFELRSRGYEVDYQVGSLGFFIDLAVKDPNKPGRYLLGIECDGAAYHSSRSARDRDRLRQQVLEGLGWKIHRIWSTDWFRHQDREVEKTIEAIKKAQASAPASKPVIKPKESSKPLVRNEQEIREAPKVTVPYEMCRLRQIAVDQLHEVERRTLGIWVQDVVEVESPVHINEVMQRICTAAGIGRAGSRIQKAIREGAAFSARTNGIKQDRHDFLWSVKERPVQVRLRDGEIPNSLKKPEMIALEEIKEALIHTVRVSIGIQAEEVVTDAVRLFGIKRVGSAYTERFTSVLDRTIQAGDLARDGDHLVVGSGS